MKMFQIMKIQNVSFLVVLLVYCLWCCCNRVNEVTALEHTPLHRPFVPKNFPLTFMNAIEFCKKIGSKMHERQPGSAIFHQVSTDGIEPQVLPKNPYWLWQNPAFTRTYVETRIERQEFPHPVWGWLGVKEWRDVPVQETKYYFTVMAVNEISEPLNEVMINVSLPFACEDSGTLDVNSPYVKGIVKLRTPETDQPFLSNFTMLNTSLPTYCSSYGAQPYVTGRPMKQSNTTDENACFWVNGVALNKYGSPTSGTSCYAVCKPGATSMSNWGLIRNIARRFFTEDCPANLRQQLLSCMSQCSPLWRSLHTGNLPTPQSCPCLMNLLSNSSHTENLRDCIIRAIAVNYTMSFFECRSMTECQDLAITGKRCTWTNNQTGTTIASLDACPNRDPNPETSWNSSLAELSHMDAQHLKCHMRINECVDLLDNSKCGYCGDQLSDQLVVPLIVGRYGTTHGPFQMDINDWRVDPLKHSLCKYWTFQVPNCPIPPSRIFSW